MLFYIYYTILENEKSNKKSIWNSYSWLIECFTIYINDFIFNKINRYILSITLIFTYLFPTEIYQRNSMTKLIKKYII